MSQISYNIVGELLKKPNHLRGLAKALKTNQMTISRKIRELYKNKVVDFKKEGRNKVVHLTRTLEAKQYVYMYEHQKLLQRILRYPRLRHIVEQIRKHPQVHLALIFGSYADETATPGSDIDVYLETDNKKLKEELSQLDSKLSIKIGWYSGVPLIKEIERNHLIIKGVEELYEKYFFIP